MPQKISKHNFYEAGDIKSENGTTALTEAASNGRNDIVKLLLSVGADKFTKNNGGQTPEDFAKNSDIKSVFSKYNDTGDDRFDKLLEKAVREKNYFAAAILKVKNSVNENQDKFLL